MSDIVLSEIHLSQSEISHRTLYLFLETRNIWIIDGEDDSKDQSENVIIASHKTKLSL